MSKKKSDLAGDLLDKEIAQNEEKVVSTGKATNLKEYAKTAPFSFNKANYKLLLAGLAINVVGFLLMIGGGSDDPAKFDAGELFSHTRITIAPMLIVLGYGIILYSIIKRTKSQD